MADEALRELVTSLSSSTAPQPKNQQSSTSELSKLAHMKGLYLPCLEIKDVHKDLPSQLKETINVDPSKLKKVPDALLRSLTCSFESVLEHQLRESFGDNVLNEAPGIVSYKASKTSFRTLPPCHDVGDAFILPQILSSTIEIELRTRILPPTSMTIKLTAPGFALGTFSRSGLLEWAAIEIDALLLHQNMVTRCNQVIHHIRRDVALQSNFMFVVAEGRGTNETNSGVPAGFSKAAVTVSTQPSIEVSSQARNSQFRETRC